MEKIIDVNIGDRCTDDMKVFGANNNLMRHLSEVRDGLKPGERRILYTMYKMGLKPNVNHKKVQTILGRTMEIHPHGDAPLHGTLTSLGQEWTNKLTLVDGYGNFGSEFGSEPSAPRYIEARLSKFAWDCFFDKYDPEIIDMKLAYDGETPEPEYLPAKYPVAMFSSQFGIGYGAYSSIPPYNFNEVIDLVIELMDNPLSENIMIYPDSPTGADIIDDGQFKEICETGAGKFRMRANAEIIEEKNSNIIRITSVPYQVSTQNIELDIIKLIDENKVSGIKDIMNHSNDKVGIKLDIILKKESDPVTILHQLYTKTDLEKTYPIKFKLIRDYKDVDYSIRTLLLQWIEDRRDTERRYWAHRLRRLTERKNKLEGMIYILDKNRAEEVLKIIKASDDEDVLGNVRKKFPEINSLQVETVKNMQYGGSSKTAKKRYGEELKKIEEESIPEARSYLKSAKKIDNFIKKELREGVKKFGSARLSKIITLDGEVKFRNTPHIVVITKEGFIKKLPEDIGEIGKIKDGDYPIEVIHCENKDDILIFDESGIISKIPVANLQNTDLSSNGTHISNFVTINGDIVSATRKPTIEQIEELESNSGENIYLLMVSRNGIIKKTPFSLFMNINRSLVGMIIKDGDRLQSVKFLVGDKEIVLFTNDGFGIRFNSGDIKETSRMSMGVKTITQTNDEYIVDSEVLKDDEKYLLIVSRKGYVKKTPMVTFTTGERTMKPIRLVTLIDDDSLVSVRTIIGDEVFNVYTKNSIDSIDCDGLAELPRLSKGKKLIPVRKGDEIIRVKKAK